MSLTNPRALLDPLVVGLNHLLEVGIGKKSGRNVSSEGTDFGPLKLFQTFLRWLLAAMAARQPQTAEAEPDTGEPAAHALARYRCFLPDLAGFTRLHRAGPGI